MKYHVATVLAAGVAVALGAAPAAFAQNGGLVGWGPRLGLSADPDQVNVGAQLDFGRIARHVRFQPSAELGVGDHVDLLALNFDAAYRFQSRWDTWSPYLGGGMGMFFVGGDGGGVFHDSNTEAGLSLLGGIERGLENGNRFFLEGKLGFMDAPAFKATVGWIFPG